MGAREISLLLAWIWKSQCLQGFSSCYELKKASTTWEQNPRGGPWWTETNLTMPRALGGSWPGRNQNPGLCKPDQLNSWYLLDIPLLPCYLAQSVSFVLRHNEKKTYTGDQYGCIKHRQTGAREASAPPRFERIPLTAEGSTFCFLLVRKHFLILSLSIQSLSHIIV